MGYKILGFIVWKGAKRYARGGRRRAKRDLAVVGASAGALLLVGVGATVAIKRGGES